MGPQASREHISDVRALRKRACALAESALSTRGRNASLPENFHQRKADQTISFGHIHRDKRQEMWIFSFLPISLRGTLLFFTLKD